MKKIILASNSKWRKQLLEMAGLKCEVHPSDASEDIPFENPEEYVMNLSKRKAENVANKLNDGIIIAADTIGYMNGEKYEKPKDRQEAFQNIQKLSGDVNIAITGVTMIDQYQNKQVTFYDEAKVYFKQMTDEEINWYIDHEENVYTSAGYSIETKASLFISKIEGDYKTIVGLPVCMIYEQLKKWGYTIQDFDQ